MPLECLGRTVGLSGRLTEHRFEPAPRSRIQLDQGVEVASSVGVEHKAGRYVDDRFDRLALQHQYGLLWPDILKLLDRCPSNKPVEWRAQHCVGQVLACGV